jgi:hypothetical protein
MGVFLTILLGNADKLWQARCFKGSVLALMQSVRNFCLQLYALGSLMGVVTEKGKTMNIKKLKEQYREHYMELTYSPVNMAFLVLWPARLPRKEQQVLRILPTKQEAQAFLAEVTN